MQVDKKATDFGLYPEFFGTPDRLVALAEYMRYLQMQAVHWTMATGERIRSRGLYAIVSDELNIDPDVLAEWVSCGEAVKWDRELQAMSPEEREEYIADLESEPTQEQLDQYMEFEMALEAEGHDFTTVEDSARNARQANYEVDVLNHLFEES